MKKSLDYYLNLKYPFLVEQSSDGSYFLKYPDLPGCMTCAQTLEEVIKMGVDAKLSWIEIALEDDREILEPREMEDYSGEFRIRIPKKLHKDLVQQSTREGISMNQYCLYLLTQQNERHLEKHGQ